MHRDFGVDDTLPCGHVLHTACLDRSLMTGRVLMHTCSFNDISDRGLTTGIRVMINTELEKGTPTDEDGPESQPLVQG